MLPLRWDAFAAAGGAVAGGGAGGVSSASAPPAPPAPRAPLSDGMTDSMLLRLSYGCTLLALLLLIAGIYGMSQTPRPGWSRDLVIPALVLVLVGRALRRRVGGGG